jgi:hypothetical protein
VGNEVANRESLRARVLRHKQELMTRGVATGAAVVANMGYACVDPMPIPVVCPSTSPSLQVDVTPNYQQGGLTVDLSDGQSALHPENPQRIQGATLLTVNGAAITIGPRHGATQIIFDITMACTGKNAASFAYRVTLSCGGPAQRVLGSLVPTHSALAKELRRCSGRRIEELHACDQVIPARHARRPHGKARAGEVAALNFLVA